MARPSPGLGLPLDGPFKPTVSYRCKRFVGSSMWPRASAQSRAPAGTARPPPQQTTGARQACAALANTPTGTTQSPATHTQRKRRNTDERCHDTFIRRTCRALTCCSGRYEAWHARGHAMKGFNRNTPATTLGRLASSTHASPVSPSSIVPWPASPANGHRAVLTPAEVPGQIRLAEMASRPFKLPRSVDMMHSCVRHLPSSPFLVWPLANLANSQAVATSHASPKRMKPSSPNPHAPSHDHNRKRKGGT